MSTTLPYPGDSQYPRAKQVPLTVCTLLRLYGIHATVLRILAGPVNPNLISVVCSVNGVRLSALFRECVKFWAGGVLPRITKNLRPDVMQKMFSEVHQHPHLVADTPGPSKQKGGATSGGRRNNQFAYSGENNGRKKHLAAPIFIS